MPSASEKGRVWIGNAFKDTKPEWEALSAGNINPYYYDDRREYEDKFGSYYQNQGFNILEELFYSVLSEKYSTTLKKRKSFIKSSKKLGIDQKIANSILQFVDDHIDKSLTTFLSMIENVVLTLNQNPNNYEIIKGTPPSDWSSAEKECYKFQQSRENPEQIMHTFEDGSYWYDLQSYSCRVEGERMGHCGGDSRGNLYSLRKRDKGKRDSKSYVTIAFNDYDKTIFQIKGRGNSCPPESLWTHIEKFIELSGAGKLEEAGEHSAEPEKFNRLGDYLSSETGIEWGGSIEQRMEDFRNECNDYLVQFRANVADDEDVQLGGLEIVESDYDEGFEWIDTLDTIVVEVPFKLKEKHLHKQEDDLGLAAEEIFEVIEEEDRNDFINSYQENAEVSFVRAVSEAEAMRKINTYVYGDELAELVSAGSKTYMVLSDLETLSDQVLDGLIRSEPDQYREFLDLVGQLYTDVRDSVDAIENLFIKEGIVDAPLVKGYKETIAKQFNNFEISPSGGARNLFSVVATGKLFDTTADEMATITATGLAPDGRPHNGLKHPLNLNRSGDGWWYSDEFKSQVLLVLRSKEKEAAEFAKRQMTLNYGEQYKKKIDSLWDKILSQKNTWILSSDMFVGFFVKESAPPSLVNRPRPGDPSRHGEDAFFYKIEVNIDEETLPIFGPFLEYYDNNFEIIIGAFDKVVKDYIYKAAMRMRKAADTEDSLPIPFEALQEARANPLDVRLYEIDFVMSYPLQQGFEITDIHNIVRAIPDVTTVRTIGTKRRTQSNRSISLQRLKFALRGQKSRKEWVKKILVPQIHKISSTIRLHRVEPADLVSSSKQRLEELYYNSSMRQSAGRTTPVPTIQSLIDDWVEGGVMYDQPTNFNLTRYSVMMPVSELEHLCGREARKHGHHFDAGYQKFIENGPRDPIYLAIGKNGRAKITGNEDDLRYAIKAGVEEVPVFISYQRQV
tara:strand:- start:1606 stop:4476 length:2871 start_codon:yes stop_codon:yes gene_type:complete